MRPDGPLKIGITGYPSIGGSGILASALGEELAARGHEVHFVSYERPFRLPSDVPRLHFHPVTISSYGLFKYPDYTLPLSVKMAEVSREHRLDILHVHYAVPHATAAFLALSMLGREEEAAARHNPAWHGHDPSRQGPRLWPGHPPRPGAFRRGHDGVGLPGKGDPPPAGIPGPDRRDPQFLRSAAAEALTGRGKGGTRPEGRSHDPARVEPAAREADRPSARRRSPASGPPLRSSS